MLCALLVSRMGLVVFVQVDRFFAFPVAFLIYSFSVVIEENCFLILKFFGGFAFFEDHH
jgi:hypothetical protein